jgi:hypothetical protein
VERRVVTSPLQKPASQKREPSRPHLLFHGVDHHQMGILQLAVSVSLGPRFPRLREPVAAAFVLHPVKRAAGLYRP